MPSKKPIASSKEEKLISFETIATHQTERVRRRLLVSGMVDTSTVFTFTYALLTAIVIFRDNMFKQYGLTDYYVNALYGDRETVNALYSERETVSRLFDEMDSEELNVSRAILLFSALAGMLYFFLNGKRVQMALEKITASAVEEKKESVTMIRKLNAYAEQTFFNVPRMVSYSVTAGLLAFLYKNKCKYDELNNVMLRALTKLRELHLTDSYGSEIKRINFDKESKESLLLLIDVMNRMSLKLTGGKLLDLTGRPFSYEHFESLIDFPGTIKLTKEIAQIFKQYKEDCIPAFVIHYLSLPYQSDLPRDLFFAVSFLAVALSAVSGYAIYADSAKQKTRAEKLAVLQSMLSDTLPDVDYQDQYSAGDAALYAVKLPEKFIYQTVEIHRKELMAYLIQQKWLSGDYRTDDKIFFHLDNMPLSAIQRAKESLPALLENFIKEKQKIKEYGLGAGAFPLKEAAATGKSMKKAKTVSASLDVMEEKLITPVENTADGFFVIGVNSEKFQYSSEEKIAEHGDSPNPLFILKSKSEVFVGLTKERAGALFDTGMFKDKEEMFGCIKYEAERGVADTYHGFKRIKDSERRELGIASEREKKYTYKFCPDKAGESSTAKGLHNTRYLGFFAKYQPEVAKGEFAGKKDVSVVIFDREVRVRH